MHDISEHVERARIANIEFRIVGMDGLRELYRKELVETADKVDDNSQIKHRAIREKLRSLDTFRT